MKQVLIHVNGVRAKTISRPIGSSALVLVLWHAVPLHQSPLDPPVYRKRLAFIQRKCQHTVRHFFANAFDRHQGCASLNITGLTQLIYRQSTIRHALSRFNDVRRAKSESQFSQSILTSISHGCWRWELKIAIPVTNSIAQFTCDRAHVQLDPGNV